jgi:hypothetical protein
MLREIREHIACSIVSPVRMLVGHCEARASSGSSLSVQPRDALKSSPTHGQGGPGSPAECKRLVHF